ncbi:SDR family NAD(P)-dependent oxidoreductase [Actinoplanes friuliensis]|jgi:NAD(P)-dependent dehydrogenase (short-subunit alcohol dehydrogenase family)|uniref:Short-chain dehydrogenase/reductase SDR n=1 Tax=Actinoplanes friuliensis DSM 7358 TaxID=1246995 RepID=U5W0E2_9ACTN|nr:SDR family NAD(P)-dependent oxidoreductase [Actinoplanes friuliensis]AGZ42559.1 short-chain dehydrogenase/reductase SDR [Actinoplanes friuliensis DSM 7358]
MDLQLAGKRVLVTGASKGIGLAVVQAFQDEGASVVAVSRRSTPGLEKTGAEFFAADLSAPDGPQRMVEAVLAADPRLDVLVNNAGGGTMPEGALGDALDGDNDAWAEVFALNLLAAVRTTRAALPALSRARGAVVNVSSDSARRPIGVPLPYASAKAALNTFSRGLAEKYTEHGVRINVVTPSGTRTDLMESPDGFVAQLAASMNLEHGTLLAALPGQSGMLTGVLIEPSEIARAVVLLSSPTMPSAIGSNWSVDAGALKVA